MNGTIFPICPAVWQQHRYGCRGLLFPCNMVTTRVVKTPRVCSPCYVKVMWPCVTQQWFAVASARFVNKQSVQTVSIARFLQPAAPGTLCARSNPAWQQGRLHAQILSQSVCYCNVLERDTNTEVLAEALILSPSPPSFCPSLVTLLYDSVSLNKNAWVRPSRVKDSFLMLT